MSNKKNSHFSSNFLSYQMLNFLNFLSHLHFRFRTTWNLLLTKIRGISNEHLRCRKKFYFILLHPFSGKWQTLGHCFEVLHNYVPSTRGIFWMCSCLFMMPISVLILVRKRKTVIFSGKNQTRSSSIV